MKANEKIIAAFLVSMGLFTSVQAKIYVASLSDGDKIVLHAAASDDESNVSGTQGSRDPVENN